jgi:hypothetical protein
VPKSFDFNSFSRPALEVKLSKDTVLNVTTPAERMIEQLMSNADEISKLKDSKDAEAVRACFAFGAELISNNLEDVTVTAEELRDKYKVSTFGLLAFFRAYVDFIAEITNAKN